MPKFSSVDDYLASLPVEQRVVVEEIERRVLVVAPAAERVIRYDMPTWQVDGTSLVHVAAWKKHVSLYPVPPEGDRQLDADLAPYAGAKGTLKLRYSEIDYMLIERAVRRLLETLIPTSSRRCSLREAPENPISPRRRAQQSAHRGWFA